MKVSTKLVEQQQDFTLEEMPKFSVGIMTVVPSGWSSLVGEPVIRVFNEYFFPKRGTWNPSCSKARARRLLPGESILLEGE